MTAASVSATSPQLILRRLGRAHGAAHCTWIALHDEGGDCRTHDALLAAVARHAEVLVPQAPRPCNPLASGRALGESYGGYRWYLRAHDGTPDPASLGDALEQLRSLCIAGAADARKGLVVIGVGQGANLALIAQAYRWICADIVVAIDPSAASLSAARFTDVESQPPFAQHKTPRGTTVVLASFSKSDAVTLRRLGERLARFGLHTTTESWPTQARVREALGRIARRGAAQQ